MFVRQAVVEFPRFRIVSKQEKESNKYMVVHRLTHVQYESVIKSCCHMSKRGFIESFRADQKRKRRDDIFEGRAPNPWLRKKKLPLPLGVDEMKREENRNGNSKENSTHGNGSQRGRGRGRGGRGRHRRELQRRMFFPSG